MPLYTLRLKVPKYVQTSRVRRLEVSGIVRLLDCNCDPIPNGVRENRRYKIGGRVVVVVWGVLTGPSQMYDTCIGHTLQWQIWLLVAGSYPGRPLGPFR